MPPNADDDGYLYHTTSYAAADQIGVDGLQPRRGAAGMFQHGGYDLYAQGKIFLADRGAAHEWFSKVEDQLEHYAADDGDLDERMAEIVPVMLRVDKFDLDEDPQVDDLGSRDVIGGTSYYVTQPIDSAYIEFWHPKRRAWVSLDDGLPDARLGIATIEYYDDEGNPVDEDEWDGENPPGITPIGAYDPGGFKPPHES